VKFFKPSIVHLCDDITKKREGSKLLQLRLKESLADIKIMRTLPVPVGHSNMDFIEELFSDFEESSDFFLLDTWVDEAPVQNYIGITGRTCNWDIAKRIVEASKKPCILAGGLSPENVYNAISYVRPYGVDTCTQTNRRDSKGDVIRFQKDFFKLEKFVKEARRGFRENELH
ncbi:MAG: phosphoribosylanthranilate isomerase, partial [Desulfatiglandales bacterium]